MLVKPFFFTPSFEAHICGSNEVEICRTNKIFQENPILFYEDTGFHQGMGRHCVHLYYAPHLAIPVFVSEKDKKAWLESLTLHEKSVGDSGKDYAAWRAGIF
jgi:hypothetical protein